jgi:hypothetical protein
MKVKSQVKVSSFLTNSKKSRSRQASKEQSDSYLAIKARHEELKQKKTLTRIMKLHSLMPKDIRKSSEFPIYVPVFECDFSKTLEKHRGKSLGIRNKIEIAVEDVESKEGLTSSNRSEHGRATKQSSKEQSEPKSLQISRKLLDNIDYSKLSDDKAKSLFVQRWRQFQHERESTRYSNYEQKIKVNFDPRLQIHLDKMNGVAPQVNQLKQAF